MSIGKALLIGAIGVGAGLLLAAWAESMNDSDSKELDLDDLNDDTDLGESDETVEAETDETLKEQPANA